MAGRNPKGFTANFIDGLAYSPNAKREVIPDPIRKGLGILISAKTKTFIVQCRVKGRLNSSGRPLEVKKTIGRFGKNDENGLISLDTALTRYNEILADASKGITPDEREQMDIDAATGARLHQQQVRQEDEAKNVTLSQLVENYITARKNLKNSTINIYRNCLTWYLPPDWLTIPARTITGDMVLKQHAEIGKRSPAMANQTMKVIGAAFNFAADDDTYGDAFIKNPTRKLTRNNSWYTIDPRETAIPVADFEKGFSQILQIKNQKFKMAALFMLFTGSRKEETYSLKWSNFNFANNTVLQRFTKSGKPLYVPMAQWLVDQLYLYKEDHFTGNAGYVFDSYSADGYIKDQRKSYINARGADGIIFTPHALRHTVTTYMKNNKFHPAVIDRLTNHAAPKTVADGYISHEIDLLREDVETLADYILRLAIVGPHISQAILDERRAVEALLHSDNNKVVPIRKAA